MGASNSKQELLKYKMFLGMEGDITFEKVKEKLLEEHGKIELAKDRLFDELGKLKSERIKLKDFKEQLLQDKII